MATCLDVYKNKLITEERTCKYCGTKFALEKYYAYESCPKCRMKEFHEKSKVEVVCVDCKNKFITNSPSSIRCKSCSRIFAKTLEKTQCSKCGRSIYDVQEDGLCAICRRDIDRKKLKSICVLCGDKALPRKPYCKKCYDKVKLESCAKKCKFCGNEFTPKSIKSKNNKFCSDKCRKAYSKARHDEKIGTKTEIEAKILDILNSSDNISNASILKLLGISYCALNTRGVSIQDIRNKVSKFYTPPKVSKSKFEAKVLSILEEVMYPYKIITQKTFADLTDKKNLRYDFYIEELNLLIEADGTQHYVYPACIRRFDDPSAHDELKNRYARENNINLLRVKYFSSVKKENELKSTLKTIKRTCQETGKTHLFNCWNGGDKLLPISSQAL